MNTAGIIGLIAGAIGGAAVGLERQWSGHAEGPAARFAGIRTFTMLGTLGALAGLLWLQEMRTPSAILLAGAVGIVVAGYVAGSRRDVDGTTEVAALIVITAGVLAGTGAVPLASGLIALTVLLLVEKTSLHAAARRINDNELRSAARFAAMALIVLPLLPQGPFGPLGGVRPRQLWAIVLFFSGLSFAGYLARRLVGPGRGYLVTGILGGVISSTNVTLTFARTSRRNDAVALPLAVGAIGANAMLYPRVLVASATLNAPVAAALVPYLAVPAVAAALACVVGAYRTRDHEVPQVTPDRNPLQLATALQMALLFQLVLIAVAASRQLFGDTGVLTSAAVLGLTDVDALTVSMTTHIAQVASIEIAARAIAVGVLANTAMKLVLAVVFGQRAFRLVAGGALVLMLISLAAALAATPP